VHLYGKSPDDHALDGEYNLAWRVKELESTMKAVEVQSNTKPKGYEVTPYTHTLCSMDIVALDVELEDDNHRKVMGVVKMVFKAWYLKKG